MTSAIEKLRALLRKYGRISVAHSGGLDSTVLLAVVAQELGAENCLAITACSPYMMESETARAQEFCKKIGVARLELQFGIADEIKNNPPDRCYLCKRAIFSRLIAESKMRGFQILADGTNADDLSDYRPGMRALKELEVASPLLEVGIGKSVIREIARGLCPEFAESPAYACLMTRFETNAKVDDNSLRRVDEAENYLRSLGFACVRVRVHGDCARIEAMQKDFAKLFDFENMKVVNSRLRALGFKHVSGDFNGYERGSMNEGQLK